jgi:hypothetical protein
MEINYCLFTLLHDNEATLSSIVAYLRKRNFVLSHCYNSANVIEPREPHTCNNIESMLTDWLLWWSSFLNSNIQVKRNSPSRSPQSDFLLKTSRKYHIICPVTFSFPDTRHRQMTQAIKWSVVTVVVISGLRPFQGTLQ